MIEEEYLTPQEAAAYIRSTENSLRSMRCTGIGPAFHVVGTGRSRVRYRRADLDAYLASRIERLEKEKGLTGARLPVRP